MQPSDPSICPTCKSPIPADAPGGLCPACTLEGASTVAATTKGGPNKPPSIEEIAPYFPDLEILELLGSGGMGTVYKARQPQLDRFVAIKILSEELAKEAAFVERFNREAKVLARLSHPNIVAVFDYGTAGSFCFLLMEYVDGVNLRQALRTGGFKPAEALALAGEMCSALQFAHEEGVLHRDIKPENVLIDSKGRVKIADFGIAKLLGPASAQDITLTLEGAAIGTPNYMAPEQIEAPGDVDQRADIYSLGVVLYEMLTGELPIGRFALPSEKAAMDTRIDQIVLRALEKEREARFQSAAEVETEVEAMRQFTNRGNGQQVSRGQDTRLVVKKTTWPYRALIFLVAPLLAIGLYWLYVVIHEIASGRSLYGASQEAALAMALAGVSLAAILWSRRRLQKLRSLTIDRHILRLASTRSEIQVSDLVSMKELDLGPEQANECLHRLAKNGVGSVEIDETGSTVFRLPVDNGGEAAWLEGGLDTASSRVKRPRRVGLGAATVTAISLVFVLGAVLMEGNFGFSAKTEYRVLTIVLASGAFLGVLGTMLGGVAVFCTLRAGVEREELGVGLFAAIAWPLLLVAVVSYPHYRGTHWSSLEYSNPATVDWHKGAPDLEIPVTVAPHLRARFQLKYFDARGREEITQVGDLTPSGSRGIPALRVVSSFGAPRAVLAFGTSNAVEGVPDDGVAVTGLIEHTGQSGSLKGSYRWQDYFDMERSEFPPAESLKQSLESPYGANDFNWQLAGANRLHVSQAGQSWYQVAMRTDGMGALRLVIVATER